MQRKTLIASIFSTILILVTFTNFASSMDSLSVNTDESVKADNLVNAVVTVFDRSEDISLDDLIKAEELIQTKIIEKISEPATETTLDPPHCIILLNNRDKCRELANEWRKKADESDNPIWKKICNLVADRYDFLADIFQLMYDINCT